MSCERLFAPVSVIVHQFLAYFNVPQCDEDEYRFVVDFDDLCRAVRILSTVVEESTESFRLVCGVDAEANKCRKY